MYIALLKSKIHRATVTQSDLDYVGSITIDKTLMDAAGLFEADRRNKSSPTKCCFCQ